MRLRLLIAGFILTLLSACSMVKVHRVDPTSSDAEGLRYFMSAPYLLVSAPLELSSIDGNYVFDDSGTPQQVSEVESVAGAPAAPPKKQDEPAKTDDGSQGAKPDATGKASIIWMPDYCQTYRISVTNILATTTVDAKFVNGSQLDSLNSTVNSTEVVNKLLDTVGGIITAAAGVAKAANAPAPGALAEARRRRGKAPQVWRCTETVTLRAGVYPLLAYGNVPVDSITDYPHQCLGAIDGQPASPHISMDRLLAGPFDRSLRCQDKPIGSAK